MIFYDGVIYSLQQSGGVSVLFNELVKRVPADSYVMAVPDLKYPWQRYMGAPVPSEAKGVFHSTYYRLPDSSGLKVVTTVHDFTYEKYRKGPAQWVHTWQKRRSINASDAIICVSENTKNDLLEIFGYHHESKVFVVHNGVSEDYKPLGSNARTSQVLFVGSRQGYKNFSNVVEALSYTSNLSLLCVGGGEFTKSEIALLEQNIAGRYRYAGLLSNQQLNVEYNASMCLVYPSLYEGFGIPVLEAMRAGCPVVAVRTSSIPEVAGNAAVMLDNGSVDEIRRGLEMLSGNECWKDCSRLGFLQAAKFSWDKTFAKTLAVYEELLGCPLNEFSREHK